MHFLFSLQAFLHRVTAPAAYGLAGAGVLSIIAMMCVVTFDVIGRYLFNQPTVWADEVASFLMIAVVFCGLAQNLCLGDHIRIDVVTNLMSARTRFFLDLVAHAVCIVFATALFVACWTRFDNFWVRQTTSDSPIMLPLWIPAVPVLLGAAVFCLAAVAGFVTRLHALLSGTAIVTADQRGEG